MPDLDLLVCAATSMELQTFGLSEHPSQNSFLTGVGIPLALTKTLETAARLRPKHILNIGIAGAYPDSGLKTGDIVIGLSEVYGDIGFELPEQPGFRHIGESPWGEFYRAPLPLTQFTEFPALHVGHGCTVSTCTGTEETGQLRATTFQAAFETMEGAAVAHAGQLLGIPVCEIRAISNLASKRDMRPENIRLALESLTVYFERCREETNDEGLEIPR